MVNVVAFRTTSVKLGDFVKFSPFWCVVFYVMVSAMFSSRAGCVFSPFFSPSSVNNILYLLVSDSSKFLSSLIISGVFYGLFSFPCFSIIGISSNIQITSIFRVDICTWLAFMGNSIAFFVIIAAWLFNSTRGANFKFKGLFTWFHIRDIIAHIEGDVKQGENGETPDRTIPCQASAFKRALEGVTTRGRAKAVIPPRAPCLVNFTSDEIVCSTWEHVGALDKEPRTLTNRTTIESRTKKAVDNLTNNNALLRRMKERGNVKTISGGTTVLQELFYNDPVSNVANSYSGYETIDISPDSPISAAQFNVKHYASSVTISGPELLANSSKEQMIDLLATRVEIAEARLQNKIDLDLHGSEATNAKNLSGLADMLTTGTAGQRVASGTYGGINRASWAFWRHWYETGTSATGAAATASTIQRAMNKVALKLVRGNDKVDIIYADDSSYNLYLQSMQAIQRVTNEDSAAGGFSSLKFYGGGQAADVILGGGIGGNLNSVTFADGVMLFLNTKHMFFRPHRDRNFVAIGGDRQSVNQDAVVRLYGWSGALTCDGLQFQGRLNSLT